MKKPITANTAIASKAIIMNEAICSPNPKCEASAANPRPAANPATGPIHERFEACAADCVEAAADVAAFWVGAIACCLTGA